MHRVAEGAVAVRTRGTAVGSAAARIRGRALSDSERQLGPRHQRAMTPWGLLRHVWRGGAATATSRCRCAAGRCGRPCMPTTSQGVPSTGSSRTPGANRSTTSTSSRRRGRPRFPRPISNWSSSSRFHDFSQPWMAANVKKYLRPGAAWRSSTAIRAGAEATSDPGAHPRLCPSAGRDDEARRRHLPAPHHRVKPRP